MRKLLMAMLLLAAASAIRAQDGQARIVEVQGKVEIQEPASPDWRNAQAGDPVTDGTVISTGFKSTAVIALGASQIIVQPLTMLTLEEIVQRENSGETYLYLRSGRIRANISLPTGANSTFSVRSSNGGASVRGTSFEFDGRYLWIESGIVRLENNNGQQVYVAEGRHSFIDESNLDRVVPPFEAEGALLQPRLPELDRIGRQRPAASLPGSGGGSVSGGNSGLGLNPIWP